MTLGSGLLKSWFGWGWRRDDTRLEALARIAVKPPPLRLVIEEAVLHPDLAADYLPLTVGCCPNGR